MRLQKASNGQREEVILQTRQERMKKEDQGGQHLDCQSIGTEGGLGRFGKFFQKIFPNLAVAVSVIA